MSIFAYGLGTGSISDAHGEANSIPRSMAQQLSRVIGYLQRMCPGTNQDRPAGVGDTAASFAEPARPSDNWLRAPCRETTQIIRQPQQVLLVYFDLMSEPSAPGPTHVGAQPTHE